MKPKAMCNTISSTFHVRNTLMRKRHRAGDYSSYEQKEYIQILDMTHVISNQSRTITA